MKADLHTERREQILAAAKHAFAQLGFHKAQMGAIAAEAGMSPGNLYRYFRSKKAIIAAFAEQDRLQTFEELRMLAAAPSLIEGLVAIAARFLDDQRGDDFLVSLEIASEICRNPSLAKFYSEIDKDGQAQFIALIRAAQDRGEVDPSLNAEAICMLLIAVADGLGWRQAIDPAFDRDAVLTALSAFLHKLLLPSAK
jgi:AcrR family transcriptional regulator